MVLFFVPEKNRPLKRNVLPFNISISIDFTDELYRHLTGLNCIYGSQLQKQLSRFKYVTEVSIDHCCVVTACLDTDDFAAAYRRTLQLRKKILRAILRWSKFAGRKV
jgi:hypothetical protein